jgi:hypothetical protein
LIVTKASRRVEIVADGETVVDVPAKLASDEGDVKRVWVAPFESVNPLCSVAAAFKGQGRGGELPAHDGWMETCFRRSETLLDVPLLRRIWEVMRELPRGESPDRMNHGDLIPGNVLVADGRLAGVLDVGGLGPADPTLDLVRSGWPLVNRLEAYSAAPVVASDPVGSVDVVPVISLLLPAPMAAWLRH